MPTLSPVRRAIAKVPVVNLQILMSDSPNPNHDWDSCCGVNDVATSLPSTGCSHIVAERVEERLGRSRHLDPPCALDDVARTNLGAVRSRVAVFVRAQHATRQIDSGE